MGMKEYNCLLVYNDPKKRDQWLEDKRQGCDYFTYDFKRQILTIGYPEDRFTGAKERSKEVWRLGKYGVGHYQDERWGFNFAGMEFYYIHYLDGLIGSQVITYLASRNRARVRELPEYSPIFNPISD